MKPLLLLLAVCVLSSCTIYKKTVIEVRGKSVVFPYGIAQIKGENLLFKITREVSTR